MEELIKKLLASRKVRKAIREAANLLARTGREVGFKVVSARGEGFDCLGPVVGGCEEIGSHHYLEESMKKPEREEKVVLEFHFHPEEKGAIIPSEDDLLSACSHDGITAIGRFDWARGRIAILFLFPSKWWHSLSEAAFEDPIALEALETEIGEIVENISAYQSEESQPQILEILNQAGFSTSLVNLFMKPSP